MSTHGDAADVAEVETGALDSLEAARRVDVDGGSDDVRNGSGGGGGGGGGGTEAAPASAGLGEPRRVTVDVPALREVMSPQAGRLTASDTMSPSAVGSPTSDDGSAAKTKAQRVSQARLRRNRKRSRRAWDKHCGSRCATCLYGRSSSASGGLCALARSRRTWALAGLFGACCALSVVVSFVVRARRLDAETDKARGTAAATLDQLDAELEDYGRTLNMMAAATASHYIEGPWAALSHEGYQLYGSAYEVATKHTTAGVGFQQYVPHAYRAAFEANATARIGSRLGRSSVVIHANIPDPTVPYADQEDYYPFVESTTNITTFGFLYFLDTTGLGAEGVSRRIAIEHCMDTGQLTATAPVDIAGNIGGGGFILYARVGQPGDGYGGVKALGVVATAVEATQLVSTLLGHLSVLTGGDAVGVAAARGTDSMGRDALTLHLTILDTTDPANSITTVNYWTDGRPFDSTPDDAITVLLDAQIMWASRVWDVAIATDSSSLEERASDGSFEVLLVAGLLSSALLVAAVAQLLNAQDKRDHARVTKLRANVAASTHQRLVSYVCHELRNPLHHLSGGMQLFLEDHALILSQPMRQELQMLTVSIAQMRHVVNDILDMRKLQAGDVAVEPLPTDVRGVVRDLAHQMRDAVHPDTTLCVTAAKNLPPLLMTDPMRLRQLLGNAAHNAAKFTESGRIDIVVRTFDRSRWLLCEVRNTGSGLGEKSGLNRLGYVSEIAQDGDGDGDGDGGGGGGDDGGGGGGGDDDDDGGFTTSQASSVEQNSGVREVGKPGTALAASVSAGGPRDSLLDRVFNWFERTMPGPDEEGTLPMAYDGADSMDTFIISRSAGDSATESLFSRTHDAGTKDSSAGPALLSTLMKASGLGLGLPLCRRVALHMGGAIGLEDVAMHFTRFWVLIPTGHGETTPALEAPASHADAARGDARDAGVVPGGITIEMDSGGDVETKPGSVDIADMCVMAVDDELVLRKLMGRFLNKLGCAEQVLLEDGFDVAPALQKLEDEGKRCDALLLDIVMKRSDGAEICRRLRSSGCTTPIYAMTGNTDHPSVAKYKQWGFNGLLAKPFGMDEVKLTLAHAASVSVSASGRIRGGWLNSMGAATAAQGHALARPKQRSLHANRRASASGGGPSGEASGDGGGGSGGGGGGGGGRGGARD